VATILRFAPCAAPLIFALVGCSATPPDRDATAGRWQGAVAPTDGWVGSWAVAPHADGTSFNDQTLRQVVHTSIGGNRLRLRISNAFGKQPLSIDNVHVAKRSSGSAIDAATDRPAKFAGLAAVSIPAGQSATSDTVTFQVDPLADLVVSFHIAGSPGGTTAHGTGLQDNYVAAGNVAGDATLNGAQRKGSYYFLTNVDVQNPEAWGAVVTLGASITDGVASGGNLNRRWPNDLAKRLLDAKRPVGVLNQGISGNRLLADGNGESALKRFERDVLAQTGVRWVIFSDDPINDLGNANPPSGDQLIDGLKQLIQRAHAAKIEFWCSTLTPYEGSGGWKPAGETARAAIIAFIQQPNSGCDRIVDQDGATHDPAKPTWFLPANDAGDHLHPNEKGLQAIADAVPLEGFTAPATDGGGAGSGGSGGGGGGGGAGAGTAGGAGAGGGMPSSGANGGGVAGTTPSAGGNAGSTGGPGSPTAGTTSSPNPAPGQQTSGDTGCACRSARSTMPWYGSLITALSLAVGLITRRRSR
jgi:lysophospholipase L1-like esterase